MALLHLPSAAAAPPQAPPHMRRGASAPRVALDQARSAPPSLDPPHTSPHVLASRRWLPNPQTATTPLASLAPPTQRARALGAPPLHSHVSHDVSHDVSHVSHVSHLSHVSHVSHVSRVSSLSPRPRLSPHLQSPGKSPGRRPHFRRPLSGADTLSVVQTLTAPTTRHLSALPTPSAAPAQPQPRLSRNPGPGPNPALYLKPLSLPDPTRPFSRAPHRPRRSRASWCPSCAAATTARRHARRAYLLTRASRPTNWSGWATALEAEPQARCPRGRRRAAVGGGRRR